MPVKKICRYPSDELKVITTTFNLENDINVLKDLYDTIKHFEGVDFNKSKKEIDEYISVMAQPEESFRHTESLQVLQKLYPYVDFSKPFKLVVEKYTDPTLKVDSYTTSVVNFPGEDKFHER